jgi:hypothetical protein
MQLREFEVGPDEAVVAGASLLVGEGEVMTPDAMPVTLCTSRPPVDTDQAMP